MVEVDDIVVFRATPNAGEMIVTDVKYSHRTLTRASKDNPVVYVKFWDVKKRTYNFDVFYLSQLKVVGRE